MAENLKELGARIKEARKDQGLSQSALAEKLDISLSHMSDIENGKSNFCIDIFMRLTEVLQISADKLLRTSVPEVNALYNAEISTILSDCTSTEADSLVVIMREVKRALRRARNSEN